MDEREKALGEAPAKVVLKWRDEIAIVPLNPVTEGHVIVLPKDHVQDALTDPFVGLTSREDFHSGAAIALIIHGEGRTRRRSIRLVGTVG
jgi:hypothetical protein